MSGLTLGPVALQGFEIPGQMRFGGAQAMVVHKLPGGGRVIDVMGRDDADITWSGVMSGADAASRARLMDAMRVAGDVVTLSWNAFFYAIVIARLDLNFSNPWWIPYSIACKVLTDEAQSTTIAVVTDAAAIADDLAAASSLTDVSAATAAIDSAGALTGGTLANANAILAINRTSATIGLNIQAAEALLQTADVPTLVQATGSLAVLTSAQGFVDRAVTNLKNVSS